MRAERVFRHIPKDGRVAASAEEHKTRKTAVRRSPDYPVFPFSVLRKTMRAVLSGYSDALLEKSPNAGCSELREAIRHYLIRNRGMNVESGQIIIGAGAYTA